MPTYSRQPTVMQRVQPSGRCATQVLQVEQMGSLKTALMPKSRTEWYKSALALMRVCMCKYIHMCVCKSTDCCWRCTCHYRHHYVGMASLSGRVKCDAGAEELILELIKFSAK